MDAKPGGICIKFLFIFLNSHLINKRVFIPPERFWVESDEETLLKL